MCKIRNIINQMGSVVGIPETYSKDVLLIDTHFDSSCIVTPRFVQEKSKDIYLNQMKCTVGISKAELKKEKCELLKDTYFDLVRETKLTGEIVSLEIDQLFYYKFLTRGLDEATMDYCMIDREKIHICYLLELYKSNKNSLEYLKNLVKNNKYSHVFWKEVVPQEPSNDKDIFDFSLIMNLIFEGKLPASFLDRRGNTALMWSCKCGRYDFVDKLITMDCLPSQINEYENTALILSCAFYFYSLSGQIICTKLLKTFGNKCLPHHVNTSGDTALMYACNQKLKQLALELLNFDCNPQHFSENKKHTALMFACNTEMKPVIWRLLQLNCNPGQIDIKGKTALIYSILNGMEDVALKLTEFDCSPDAVDEEGKKAIDYAEEKGMEELVKRLRDL